MRPKRDEGGAAIIERAARAVNERRTSSARWKLAGNAAIMSTRLETAAKDRKVFENATMALANSLTEAFLDSEIVAARKAKVVSLSGKLAFMAAWATFCYFILAYGTKMYETVGKGSEQDFLNTWVVYMVVDNVLLAWTTSFKNAAFKQSVAAISKNITTALDPFAWFESFDDSVMHDSLEDDVADDLDEMDDMEAVDIFSNPLESG